LFPVKWVPHSWLRTEYGIFKFFEKRYGFDKRFFIWIEIVVCRGRGADHSKAELVRGRKPAVRQHPYWVSAEAHD